MTRSHLYWWRRHQRRMLRLRCRVNGRRMFKTFTVIYASSCSALFSPGWGWTWILLCSRVSFLGWNPNWSVLAIMSAAVGRLQRDYFPTYDFERLLKVIRCFIWMQSETDAILRMLRYICQRHVQDNWVTRRRLGNLLFVRRQHMI